MSKYSNRSPLSTLVLKDDPFASFSLPSHLVDMLHRVRRKSHRNLDNEILARIACSLQHEARYLLLQPSVRFDFLPFESENADSRKMLKVAYAKKKVHEQLTRIKAYFEKQEGFIAITQQFPKELWRRVQIKALEQDNSIEEEMSLRLTATLQEPALFGLPPITVNKKTKGYKHETASR